MIDTLASSSKAPAPSATGASWKPERRSRWLLAGISLGAVAASLAVLYAWQLPPFDLTSRYTDNASIEGNVTVIAPQVSGYVSRVLVHDYQKVNKGDTLVLIDDSIFRAQVAQAKASLDTQLVALDNNRQAHAEKEADLEAALAGVDNAKAQLVKAQADMTRADDLIKDAAIARSAYDQAQAALQAAQAQVRTSQANEQIAREGIRTVDVMENGLRAQVEVARAALQLAQINLSHATISAPDDGQLGEINVQLGQLVQPGTQLFALVPPDFWVIANYKEAQTSNIFPGQFAEIWVDALGGARLTGHVEHLSPAAGSEFAVLKPDNATGNFVKVPERIGVLIRVDPGQPLADRLRPGMSVESRIHTSE